MKKIIILILISINASAQYNPDAPWMQSLANKKTTVTLEEIKASFDEYWKAHDPNIKGSGHKPFMRWYTNVENQRKADGSIETYEDLMVAFNQKKQNQKAQSVAVTSAWTPIHGSQSFINTGSWSSGQGRISCITVAPSNANIIYVGTPAGGIWKSIDAGLTFIPLSDDLPQIGVNSIAVDYANSDIVYIATGDRDGANTSSEGIWKTTNGGTTWTLTGLTKTLTGSYCPEIYIHPTNSNMLWCATNNGVYRTINAGTTWTKTLTTINIRDFKIKPNDPTVLYASTSTLLFSSTDSGATFTQVGAGLPGDGGRMAIAVTAANSNVVYALSVLSTPLIGLYKSTDSGANFVAVNTTSHSIASSQAYYDMAMTVSPTNENEIYTGFLNIYKSIDGGTTFTQVNNWSAPATASYSHADIHFLRYYGSKLYCGSDGGVYVSSNGGTNFTDLTKSMQIGQPYKIAVAKQTSTKIIAGLQDNGGHIYNGTRWQNYYGADGMDVAVSPINANQSYGFIQFGGKLYGSSTNGATRTSISIAPAAETGTNDDGGKWVTPLAVNSLGEFFSAYKNFYKLVSNAWVVQNTTLNTIGTSDAELIAIDPSNNNNIFIANDRELYKSTDKGLTFNKVHTNATANIVALTVHSTDSNIVYYNTSTTIFKSIDGGTTFAAMNSTGLPNISKTCLVHQNNTINSLFVGTTLGVYYIDDTLTAWTPFETGLPNTKVTDLEINYTDYNITAGTYGRGVWQSPLPTVLASEEFERSNFIIYPNPSLDIFNLKIGDIQPQFIEVTDISGKIVYAKKDFDNSGNEIQINMSNTAKGIYFIKITTENKSVTKKIIKN